MYRRIVEMGGNFTGVKNEKLTRILALVFAASAVAAAAGLVLIQPAEMVSKLDAKGIRPAIFHTGPAVLYRSKHIPGSIYAGPGSSPAGLAMLKDAAAKLPHDREIVIYCGCCPWDRCPNVQPAVDLLRGLGFTNVKALYLGTGFKADWIDKGYRTE
jgi:thiosulfate/3-mercaptopyruvate sulfurtransferase